MSNDSKDFNKRMSDSMNIPPLNGTVKTLIDLSGAPLETQEQQQTAIRELIKLNLHSYLMIKQTQQDLGKSLDDLQKALDVILNERKSIIERIIDKFVVPILFMVLLAILALVFRGYIPP